ncbi:MAG: hypothetical protein RLY67_637, partial [Pseudomonadota bacterium]
MQRASSRGVFEGVCMAVLEYALFIKPGDTLLPYALAVLLSSFLLFLVQPIIAKQIVPWFGGSAS